MKQDKYVVLKDTPGEWGVALDHVEYHRELCNTEELAHGLVDGGGMWRVNHNNKNILFYGKSDDFGYPKHIAEAGHVNFQNTCGVTNLDSNGKTLVI